MLQASSSFLQQYLFLYSKPTEDFGITLVYFATLGKKAEIFFDPWGMINDF